tara:strand:+ start:3247 stop:4455 length:1209 start_codon:yes stop_codon:yes gene_type:complete
MSKKTPSAGSEEKSITSSSDRWEGQEPVGVLQSVLDQRNFDNVFRGRNQASGNVDGFTRTLDRSGVRDRAIDEKGDVVFDDPSRMLLGDFVRNLTRLDVLTRGAQNEGRAGAQARVVSNIGKAVIEQAKQMKGIDNKLLDGFKELTNIGLGMNTLMDLGDAMLDFMGESKMSDAVGAAGLEELGNVLLGYMTDSDIKLGDTGESIARLGNTMSEFISESRRGTAALLDSTNTMLDVGSSMLDFMENFKANAASVATDMIQPGSALTAAADMLGWGQEEKHSGGGVLSENDDFAAIEFEDFVSELMASGVSEEDAKVAAEAVDQDKSGSISGKELASYDTSKNSVVDKAIKDPRFRNRLVKRQPYSSIYGSDLFTQFNQTRFVDSSFALDSESFNQENVVFSQ